MGLLRAGRPLPTLMIAIVLPLLALGYALTPRPQPQPLPTATHAPTPTPWRSPTPPPTATIAVTATAAPVATPTARPGMIAERNLGYVPILMYHYIREVDAAVDPLGFRLSVRPDRFAEQMAWLERGGFTPLTMRDLAACLRGERHCPERPVAITFDDGYADQAEHALPVLRRYGFPATFYIVTGFVGREGYMGWEELAALRDAGMELGAHTHSHADLTGLSQSEATREITLSRSLLEQRLGVEVVSFSYPAGSYNGALAALVHRLGFSSAVITAPRERVRMLYHLPRRRVLGGETIEGFAWYVVPPVEE
ncbi:MAG: hypothetical protein OHK0015_50440 [Chloroflexi bacterium OHK40]